ncbi:MAG: alpha/beta fold hydrolase [Flavobacteriaceae bacterium]
MSQQLSLQHNYRESSLSEQAPLIIMLHGYGSDENDLFSFASELPKEYAIISLKAPHTLIPYGNAWYHIYFDAPQGKWSDETQAIESRELIIKVIDEIISVYPIDKNNITLLGFSQGTILSFAVALSYPEKIKNVIGLSGYINKDILKEGYTKNNFNGLNVYSSHGSVDQVIPVDWARNTKPLLQSLHINCHYSEYPVGHGVSPQNFQELKEWLKKHS